MRVLLTGANGFIGRQLLARLLTAGHEVLPAVRRPAETDRLLPRPASIAVDFNRDTRIEDWLPRLHAIDAVVNCAGILQGRPGQSIAAIHDAAPRALFDACARAGVRRVVQISAISATAAAGTDYARTKRAADDALIAMGDALDWVVLRPSLVYGPGAYGGTALFRALAALPFAIPVPGDGAQPFQPIHIDDLAATVLRALEDAATLRQKVIDPVGPERLTLREVLVDLRRWLGFAPAPVLPVPMRLIRLAARLGDLLGGSVNTTALRQMEAGNAGDPAPFVAATGIRPRRWRDALLAAPATAQDRWHARLYFARPLLRWTLAALWIGSGVVGLLQPAEVMGWVVGALGLPAGMAPLGAIASVVDIALGIAVLSRRRPGLVASLQCALVAAYTVALGVALPGLWSDPFGPLLKNLPILAAILALAAIETDR
jgi:nucleoside-diphosphate-sugar epimerase